MPSNDERVSIAQLIPTESERLANELAVAMLGTDDGGFIDSDDTSIPVGEMYRLANDFMQARLHRQGQITEAMDSVRDEAVALYKESEWTTYGVIAALRSAYEAGARREGRATLQAAEEARHA